MGNLQQYSFNICVHINYVLKLWAWSFFTYWDFTLFILFKSTSSLLNQQKYRNYKTLKKKEFWERLCYSFILTWNFLVLLKLNYFRWCRRGSQVSKSSIKVIRCIKRWYKVKTVENYPSRPGRVSSTAEQPKLQSCSTKISTQSELKAYFPPRDWCETISWKCRNGI